MTPLGSTRYPLPYRVSSLGSTVVLLCSASLSAACCAQTPALPAGQAVGSPSASADTASLVIGPGDLLDIQVFNTPELSTTARVDQDGSVKLALVSEIHVAGLTAEGAASAIERSLRDDDILLDPHVRVSVTQYASKGVTVLGEVQRPGNYPLFGRRSLYDALAAAGGTTHDEGSRITITQPGAIDTPIIVDVRTPNYSGEQMKTIVQPGATIVVSRAELIYVVGDVARPGPVPVVSGVPLSVLNVLSLAQGLNRTALSKHASIIRQTNGGVQTIAVNLDRVMRSQDANLILEPSDILVVPRSGKKVFLEYAIPSATSAVTSAVSTALIVR